MIKLIIPLNVRSKKNSHKLIPIPVKRESSWKFVYKKGGMKNVLPMTVPSDAYIKFDKEFKSFLKTIEVDKSLFNEKVSIKALFFFKGQRPDLSGSAESLGDLLEGIYYENDRQIESWDGSRVYHISESENDMPRIEIEIKKFGE